MVSVGEVCVVVAEFMAAFVEVIVDAAAPAIGEAVDEFEPFIGPMAFAELVKVVPADAAGNVPFADSVVELFWLGLSMLLLDGNCCSPVFVNNAVNIKICQQKIVNVFRCAMLFCMRESCPR